jgi:hypothetical protein
MGLGSFGPLHWLVLAGAALVFFAFLFLIGALARYMKRPPRLNRYEREYAERWKENADPFKGAP